MFLDKFRWRRLNAKNPPRSGAHVVLVSAGNGHKHLCVITQEYLDAIKSGRGIWWQASDALLVRGTHYMYIAEDPKPEPGEPANEARRELPKIKPGARVGPQAK